MYDNMFFFIKANLNILTLNKKNVKIIKTYLYNIYNMAIKLKDIYFFQDLNIELINKIIDNSRSIEVKSWVEIIKQGENSNDNAYIIKNGIASVIIDNRTIKTLKIWDVFWEIALITNEPRTATIKAMTNMKLLQINKELLHNIIKDFPNWKEIQKIMMKRIIENTKK